MPYPGSQRETKTLFAPPLMTKPSSLTSSSDQDWKRLVGRENYKMFKPGVPLVQREAQLSKFDDTVKSRVACQRLSSDPLKALAEPIVPSFEDSVYAPSDPNADWSGLVKRHDAGRSHIRGRAHASTLERTEEGGIVGPTDDAGDAGSKKHFGRRQEARSWGHPLTSTAQEEPYLTTAQAASLGQAALNGPKRRGKRHVLPAYDTARQPTTWQPSSNNDTPFRQSGSLIAQVTSSVAEALEAPPPIPLAGGRSHTKLDPHSDFINHVPGYTGKKRTDNFPF